MQGIAAGELRRARDAVTWEGKELSEKTLTICQPEPSSSYKIIRIRKALTDDGYRYAPHKIIFLLQTLPPRR